MIRLANAPCSWGTLEFEGLEGEHIGYRQMLNELAETGYVGTELGDWGYMPTDPAVLYAELEARGLAMLGGFVPVALKEPAAHGPGVAQAVRVARLLAAVAERAASPHLPFLVLADDNGTDAVRTRYAGRITPAMGLSDAAWKTFTLGASRIAQAVKDETGLRTAFHHHCAGYVETPGEIACLLDQTDPDLLGLAFDTGHYAYGAGPGGCADVLTGLDRFADRIWYIHFKECSPGVARRARAAGWGYSEAVRQGIFGELGQGGVDFSAVLAWLRYRAYRGWDRCGAGCAAGYGHTPRECPAKPNLFAHIGSLKARRHQRTFV